jgi:uncharacterized protein YqgC (DUF456 family)
MDWIPPFLSNPVFWAACLAWVFFITGLVGTLLPILPGNFIVLTGLLIHQLWVPQASVGWTFVGSMTALCILALAGDYALTYWGAKKFGATWKGGVGALAGGIIGIFIPPPLFWLFFGPLVGAVLGEMIGGQPWEQAGKSGIGSFLGGLAALAFKLALSMGMIAGFILLTA